MKKHPLVTVRPSSIHGQGLFALRDIPWGVKIIRYSGELINDREANGRIDDGADGIFELAPDENIDGRSKGSLAQFINHDRKAPNCFVLRDSREIWIVASPASIKPSMLAYLRGTPRPCVTRTICGKNGVKRGQELTYDYGPDYF
jgi:SET domain-containing protein